jgi:hypothetical protein
MFGDERFLQGWQGLGGTWKEFWCFFVQLQALSWFARVESIRIFAQSKSLSLIRLKSVISLS